MKTMRDIFLWALLGACISAAKPPATQPTQWREVLYQAFQSGALMSTIVLDDRVLFVPMGWQSLPEPQTPSRRWTEARWDSGNDPRTVERTYLPTNGGALPGIWLTKVLSYESGPDFELEFLFLNDDGTPTTLTMRLIDDQGNGCDAVLSRGMGDVPCQIRQVAGAMTAGEKVTVLATRKEALDAVEPLRAYRIRFSCRDGSLSLSQDDTELLRAQAPDPQRYTIVQFLGPDGKVLLDDIEMRATVAAPTADH